MQIITDVLETQQASDKSPFLTLQSIIPVKIIFKNSIFPHRKHNEFYVQRAIT
jgi:hypothetical protein